MSSSLAVPNNNAKPRERRVFPRATLNHYAVLVFFGEDNWGKLTNMSESGMSFEFSRPPSLRERINFSFQVMGCMPMPPDGRGLGESFEAAGEIVWMRDFERTAGVQFVNLTEGSRGQIRQWLSFEASTNRASSVEERMEEALQETPEPETMTELLDPLATSSETEGLAELADVKEPLTRLDMSESLAEPIQELDSPWATEMPVFDEQLASAKQRRKPAPLAHSNPVMARLTFMVVAGCLAAFVVTAGVKMIMSRPAHRADVVEPSETRAPGGGEPASAANVSSAASSAASSAGTAAPFQVEVTDAAGKRWMLWFVRNGSRNGADRVASNSIASADFSASAAKTTKHKEAAPAEEEPQPSREFTLAAPTRPASSGSAASSLSAEAPTIPTELIVPQRDPIGVIPTNPEVPAPETRPVGGMVQQARLIRSVAPVYPPLAKATRASGDVVVDALIDATGSVTSVKVISGPVLLQQAAMETVHKWKYEPARLDGQAVAMHLNVIVRFRLN
jgi:TonB family protein